MLLSHAVVNKLHLFVTFHFPPFLRLSHANFSRSPLSALRARMTVPSDVSSTFLSDVSTTLTPYADSNPLSRLPIPRRPRASNHSRLSRPGNFMLELTGSMEGTSQRDLHPGRRPVIFHHLHFRATPAASQPLTPISPRNCWRRRAKFRGRERQKENVCVCV